MNAQRTTATRTATRYADWSPATDTHELPAARRGNPPTRELHLLDLPPVVPARLSPRAGSGVRRVLRRLAGSPLADTLRESAQAAFWPTAIGCGLLVGLVVAVATRGQYVTWHGVESIPAGGTR